MRNETKMGIRRERQARNEERKQREKTEKEVSKMSEMSLDNLKQCLDSYRKEEFTSSRS